MPYISRLPSWLDGASSTFKMVLTFEILVNLIKSRRFGGKGECQSLKFSLALSATILPIGIEGVAAGDGALRTCNILLPRWLEPWSKIKSSTNFPSRSNAWARTPVGPLKEIHSANCEGDISNDLFKKRYSKLMIRDLVKLYLITSETLSAGTNCWRTPTWALLKALLYNSPIPGVMFFNTNFLVPLHNEKYGNEMLDKKS